jgi:ppGpp synthetase/RelA/SpoT-type nucleotidyltranferase
MALALTTEEEKQIDDLVQHFKDNEGKTFSLFFRQLRELFNDNDKLTPYIHSTKWRIKDPEHLRDKLTRKFLEQKEKGLNFEITKETLFERVNDLAGGRILHLYTTQFEKINRSILDVLDEAQYKIIEGPIAYTWDNEYKTYFKSLGVKTEDNPRMYTSVHYIIESNMRTKYTCELQVRTLAEELWGEVDHKINYPHPTEVLSCGEQIKVLARITSGSTRLVDSIFKTFEDNK